MVWPGEIHNAVSDHILWEQVLNNGRWLTSNKFVSYGGLKFGFADLYDKNTGEVWEIKPDKPKYYVSGPIQLQKYIDNIDGGMAGDSLGNGSFYYFSVGKVATVPQVYLVNYRSDTNGMIYYDYVQKFGEEHVAAIALMVAAIAAGLYNGNTIPIPGLS